MDHFIPQSNGGPTDFNNIVPSCRACNLSKGNLSVEEFRERIFKKTRIQFAPEQKEYLQTLGYDLPEQPNDIVFWFEKQ